MKGIANLVDIDAGMMRFEGIIAPHAAIREPGSKIALVNDARFDSLHFVMPRLLFRPNQLADNFTNLQKNAWDENPFRFLIQTLLKKSEPDESFDLVPAVQYSAESFSHHVQRQELSAAIRSADQIGSTSLAKSQDGLDENINLLAAPSNGEHEKIHRRPLMHSLPGADRESDGLGGGHQ